MSKIPAPPRIAFLGAGWRPPVFLWMGRRPLFTTSLAAELERKKAVVASLPRFGVGRAPR